MINAFFTLLKIGLGIIQPSVTNPAIYAKLEQDDWIWMKELAEKQGVVAIAGDGLNKLIVCHTRESVAPNIDPLCWKIFVCEWVGMMLQMEVTNKHQRDVTEALASKWVEGGLRVMIMKGQANAVNYPQPDFRSTGDVDCFLFGGYKKGNDIAKGIGARVDEGWYKHSEVFYQDEMFENHQFFVHTRSGARSKKMERELVDALNVNGESFKPLTASTLIPPVQWSAMFLTYHACEHFLTEGLRLKQLLDWAMFLKAHQDTLDWNSYYAFCERYHLRRFTDALTAICCRQLGIGINNDQIVAESPYANKILQNILYGDDYIYCKGESIWKERRHLIRSMFRYRWKYDDIFEESVWKQLWFYATGLLFKTENLK